MSKLLLIAFVASIIVTQESRIKKQQNCNDELRIEACSEDKEDPTVFSVIHSTSLNSNYDSKCFIGEVKYKWILNSNVTDEDLPVYEIKRKSLKPGEYEMVLETTVTRNNKDVKLKTKCFFLMKKSGPMAVIKGGTARTINEDEPLVMDGTKSIDIETKPNESGRLQYQWSCKVLQGTITDYCRQGYKGSTLTVPPKYVLGDYVYLFTLQTKMAEDYTWMSSANQTVTIMTLVSDLKISCEKNCPPKINRKNLIFLKVKCLKNCKGVTEESYQWTVDGGFDYDQSTQFGRNTDKFIFKEGVLEEGKSYTVRVGLKDRKGTDVMVLPIPFSIKIQACQTNPSQGIAVETVFTVKCQYLGVGESFEVFTSKDDKIVPLAKGPNLDKLKFVIPSNVDVFVKIVDQNSASDVFKLSVNVTSPPKSAAQITKLTKQVEDLIKDKSIAMAVQVANGIIEEISKNPTEQKDVKRKILKAFVESPIETQDEARQIYSLVTRLVNDSSESDPDRAEMATRVCKKGARVDFKHLRNKHYQKNMVSEIKKNTKILMGCGVDTKANFKHLTKKPLPFALTTAFPLLKLPEIGEHYDNYDVNDVVANKKKKYEMASQNYVDICQTTLKMMALAVVEGEDTMTSTGSSVSAHITRLTGEKLVGKEIQIEGASFFASSDLEEVEDAIDVMVCSWQLDPFWWNPSGMVVSTNVVLVKLTQNQTEFVKFEEPFRMVLDSRKNQTPVLHEVEAGNMTVIRVDVKKGESFFVEFDPSDTFRVLITDFDKPEEEEVQRKGQIVNSKKVLFQEHKHDYDGWHYISVVPQAPKHNQFNVSVYTLSCYSWNIDKKEWIFACPASFNSSRTKIECICNHLSILAGLIYSNFIKVDKVTSKLNFEMVLLTCPIIFICVGTIFLLYCLLVPFAASENKTVNVYVPPDISSSSRYVYLVGILTGRKPRSGTTSNICLKIYGDKHKSHSHVLNYPDPQKRILQWGTQDWFVVPTLNLLGNLTEIALWSNHTGRNPQWYCNNVTIYDLQSRQKWYFRVNAWLDLPPNQLYMKVQVCEEKPDEKRFGAICRVVPKRTHQDEFGVFKKLTLVLSIFLTSFVLCLLLYGVPRLSLNDGFAAISEWGLHFEVLLFGFVSSFGTFVIHVCLFSLFRNNKTFCGWFLLSVNVCGTIVVLLIFGFWLPCPTAWLWLTSVGIALLAYFLIFERLYEMVLNVFRKTKDKVEWIDNLPKILENVEVQRTYLFQRFGEDVLRPYFNKLYRPLDSDDIQERKLLITSRYKILALLEDTVMFICYITLLYLAIFANKNPMAVKNHNQMMTLIKGTHTQDEPTIRSIADFYEYLNLTLVPTLHIQQWYSKYIVKEPGTMSDYTNKFLGVARLRQQRVFPHLCTVPEVLNFLQSNFCRSEFWYSKQSFERYGPEPNDLARLDEVWNHTKSDEAGFAVVVGKFGIYHGGGFIAPLGRTLYNSYVNIMYLWEHHWIEYDTSVILVEFLSYNVNTNLFNAVRVMVERSSTGFFRTKTDLSTVQLLFVRNEDNVAELAIFCSFCLVVVIFTVKILSRIWQGKFLALRDLWILLDLLIVGMSYGCFVLFLQRAELVKKFLDKMESAKKNEFINYFHLIYAETIFTLAASFLVFVSTIRLWKLCRFGTVFRIMEKTLVLCRVPLFAMFFCHMVVVLAFSLLGFMVFGSNFDDFKDIPDSLVSLMRLSTHLVAYFNIDALINLNPVLGNAFFSVYMFLNILFFSLYICVIILSYYQAQHAILNEDDFTKLKRFLIKEFSYYRTSIKIGVVRLKGGANFKKRKLVTPKSDELRYENCLTMPTNVLEMMRCIVLYDLKKFSLSGVDKDRLMDRVVGCSGGDQGLEIFFSGKNEKKVIKVVHDGKLQQMAGVAELVLTYDEKKRQRAELKYKKVVEQQMNKLDFIKEVLVTILHIISNIDVE